MAFEHHVARRSLARILIVLLTLFAISNVWSGFRFSASSSSETWTFDPEIQQNVAVADFQSNADSFTEHGNNLNSFKEQTVAEKSTAANGDEAFTVPLSVAETNQDGEDNASKSQYTPAPVEQNVKNAAHNVTIYGPSDRRWLHVYRNLSDLAGFEEYYDRASATKLRQRNRKRVAALRKISDAYLDGLICNETTVAFPPHQKRQIRFLHIPKTGTTFYNSFQRYGCYEQRDSIPYIGDRKPNCTHDNLRKNTRYGLECEYNGQELLPTLVKECSPHWFYNPSPRNSLEKFLRSTLIHLPLSIGDAIERSVVGLFRLPNQRIVSAYGWNNHAWGMQSIHRKYLRNVVLADNDTDSTFARFPGVRGCQTKMMLGRNCGATMSKTIPMSDTPAQLDQICYLEKNEARKGNLVHTCIVPNYKDAKHAMSRIKQLGFAGVAEAWELSVCMFHRLFGGDPSAVEMRKTHEQVGRKTKITEHVSKSPEHKHDVEGRSDLDGFVDVADELVYAAVLDTYESKLQCILTKLKKGESNTENCMVSQ